MITMFCFAFILVFFGGLTPASATLTNMKEANRGTKRYTIMKLDKIRLDLDFSSKASDCF